MSAAVEDNRKTGGLGFAAEKAATISSFIVSQLAHLSIRVLGIFDFEEIFWIVGLLLRMIWLRKYSHMRRRATNVLWWLHASPHSAPG